MDRRVHLTHRSTWHVRKFRRNRKPKTRPQVVGWREFIRLSDGVTVHAFRATRPRYIPKPDGRWAEPGDYITQGEGGTLWLVRKEEFEHTHVLKPPP